MTVFKITNIRSCFGRSYYLDKRGISMALRQDCYGYNTTKDLRDTKFFSEKYGFYYTFGFATATATVEDIQKNMENGVAYFPFASSVDVRTILLYLENGFEVRFMSLKDFREAKKAMLE